jgi:F-type H+-transporting ATPase subunit gamma
MRPYAKKLQEMLGNIIGSSESKGRLALAAERPVQNVLLLACFP